MWVARSTGKDVKWAGILEEPQMTDPVTTTTAGAITSLAFQEFVKSGAGDLAKRFTGEVVTKMGQLRELIWNRLTGKHPAAEDALTKAKAGEKEGIDTVATLLGVELLDENFAGQVQAIAHEITLLQIEDNSSMNQTNFGGINFQTKTGDNNTNFFGGDHKHGQQ
jgi:hypothetical protein